MKNFKLIGLFILIGIYSSCNNDNDDNSQTLRGIYTETLPFSGTHQLDFVDNNTLIVKGRNSTDEEFIYELNNNIIKLNSTLDLSQTCELEFSLINNSKFEITNIFYASIPEEDTIQLVTFEK